MKSMKNKLILISFTLAVIAASSIYVYMQSLKTPKEIVQKIKVIVAAQTIPPRTLIDKKMLMEIEADKNSIFDDYIKDTSQIIGMYSKETILKNEGFLLGKLMSKNDTADGLSMIIEPGHRAMSINVSGDSGVSELLKPGDYTDIAVYLAEKMDGQKVISPDLVKLIMQNVKILAIDKVLTRAEASNSLDSEKPPTTFLVTLSVPVADVEKLALAESIGSLKLALRPMSNESNIKANIITDNELLNTDVNVNERNSTGNKTTQAGVSKDIKDNFNKVVKKYIYYKIKNGDTLKKISRIYYGNSEDYILLQQANKISDENYIETHKTIKIPVLQNKR